MHVNLRMQNYIYKNQKLYRKISNKFHTSHHKTYFFFGTSVYTIQIHKSAEKITHLGQSVILMPYLST